MMIRVSKKTNDKPKTGLGRFFNSASSLTHRFGQEEEGSATLFSLFIFLMILFICGMGVDLMRFETKRAALQNSIDAATLAATNIRSDADAEALVRDFMAKRGYDPNLVTVNVDESYTGADPANGNPGQLVARGVTANYDLDMDTYFMSLLGFETLGTQAGGGAQEGLTTVEISLVLDISGSMDGQKLTDMQEAAKDFSGKMIDPTRTDLPVAISIVPFNHSVVVPDSILTRLNAGVDASGTLDMVNIPVAAQAPYPGALTAYPRVAWNSQCVRFYDDEMVVTDLEENLDPALNPNYLMLRSITTNQELDRMAYYDQGDKSSGGGGPHSRPADDWNRRCDPTRSSILPYATNLAAIDTYIDGMTASGWTSNDTGLKWGVALLDPAFRSVVSGMVADGDLPNELAGRPYDYDPAQFMKVVVLMTDGANTNQYDLETPYKVGASRVWYSEQAANETGPAPDNLDWSALHIVDVDGNGTADRQKDWYDGYYVEMPNNAANERFLRAHEIWDFSDGVLVADTELPADAVQLDYTELYDRFSENAVANLFRDVSFGDAAAVTAHQNAEQTVENNDSANRRMSGNETETEHGMCDATKVDNDILVFTIAFQADDDAEAVMRDCATSDSFYFNAQNKAQLNQAYDTIASTITSLRLTQ